MSIGGASAARRPALAVRAGVLAGIVVLLALLTLMRFGPWEPQVFFGDDLSNYSAFQHKVFASSLHQSLTASYAEKFRPVFAIAIGGLFSQFGGRIELYMAVNAALNVASGLMAAAVAYQLSRGRLAIAVLAAVAISTSRFLLYQVTQVTGLLEGLGLFLFLSMLLFTVQLHVEERPSLGRALVGGVLACLAGWLLIFTHERYMGAGPWLAVMLLLAPGMRPAGLPGRILFGLLAVAPLFAHVAIKVLILHEAVFVGTGGTHMTLDWPGMLDRFWQALLSVLTFNHGPAYLAGWDVTTNLASTSGVFAALFVLLLAAILIGGARPRSNASLAALAGDYSLPIALAALAGLVLVPPLLTIRMEQRWLVQPFALLILMAAWFAGRMSISWPKLTAGLFAGLTVASMVVDWRISKAFPSIFFVYSERVAENVKREIIDPRPFPRKVGIVAGPDVCGWVLLSGEFFNMYADPKEEETCVGGVDSLDPKTFADGRASKIFSLNPDLTFSDITLPALETVKELAEPVRVDFLKDFDNGQINDVVKVDTPTGRGAMKFDVDLGYGSVQTLTLLTAFSYRYDHVALAPGDVLKFDPAMIYPTKQPARALVKAVLADGSVVTLYDRVLPLRPEGGAAPRERVAIPLDKLKGEVSIAFSVETPGNDSSGHWVAFRRPRIVAAPAADGPGAGRAASR